MSMRRICASVLLGGGISLVSTLLAQPHPRPPAAPLTISAARGAVQAIQSGELGDLRRLLANGLDPNAHGRRDRPLVSIAAGRGADQAVTDLIEAGADVNVRDVLGMTPLMWAAHSRSLAVVRTLLRAGADPRARDPRGLTAASYAREAATDRRVYIPFTRLSVRFGRFLPTSLDRVAQHLSAIEAAPGR
jgi:hypothetical protein